MLWSIILLAAAGCSVSDSTSGRSQRLGLNNSNQMRKSDQLTRNIVLFVARGGCCYGHIISIDRSGNLSYLVGTVSVSASENLESGTNLPKKFDPDHIVADGKYAQKNETVPPDVIEQLERLIRTESDLSFRDSTLIDDAYMYHIYLDNEQIANAYESSLKSSPERLRELVELVLGQVQLHKLPGMA